MGRFVFLDFFYDLFVIPGVWRWAMWVAFRRCVVGTVIDRCDIMKRVS